MAVIALLVALRGLRRDLAGGAGGHGGGPVGDGDLARAARLSGLSRPPRPTGCRGSTTSPPIRSIRRATRRWRGCARAMPIRSPMPGSMPPSSSARPIPISGRSATSATPQAAYDAALAVITKRTMARCVDARTPQAGRREGRIEAVARTAIMGFRDDVVVRVRAERRRRAHRRALVLALRHVRFRHQCRAHPQPARTTSRTPFAAQKPERPPATPPPAQESRARQERSAQEVEITPSGSGPRSRAGRRSRPARGSPDPRGGRAPKDPPPCTSRGSSPI